MDKLKCQFSKAQVQPLNFGSGYFSSSNVGQYIDFNVTNVDMNVIQDIYVVMVLLGQLLGCQDNGK